MKIRLLVIGKTNESWLDEGIKMYLKRLVHYIDFTLEVVPDVKQGGVLEQETLKEKESEAFLKRLDSRDEVYLLDEKGKSYSSPAFAKFFEKRMVSGSKQIVFVIGGAFGFGKKLHDRAQGLISLSEMTFSHQMVRVIFVEQVYRAFTIVRGEGYHHSD